MRNIKKLGLGISYLGLCYLALKFQTGDLSYILLGLIGAPVVCIIFDL